jgi:hypothetical protein
MERGGDRCVVNKERVDAKSRVRAFVKQADGTVKVVLK